MALWGIQEAVKLRASKTTSRWLMAAAEAAVAIARMENFIFGDLVMKRMWLGFLDVDVDTKVVKQVLYLPNTRHRPIGPRHQAIAAIWKRVHDWWNRAVCFVAVIRASCRIVKELESGPVVRGVSLERIQPQFLDQFLNYPN